MREILKMSAVINWLWKLRLRPICLRIKDTKPLSVKAKG
jgi:hypothetical protein